MFHGCHAHFVVIANYASLCTMELNVNKEITCKRQNHSFFSNKYTVRLISFQKPTISVRFNLLQVCPSVPTFVFAVLLLPSFNVLSGYFFVSLNSVAVPNVRILIKFGVTQLL